MSRNTCAARSAPTRIFLEIPLARAGFRSTIFLNFPVYSASKFRQIYVACDTIRHFWTWLHLATVVRVMQWWHKKGGYVSVTA